MEKELSEIFGKNQSPADFLFVCQSENANEKYLDEIEDIDVSIGKDYDIPFEKEKILFEEDSASMN